MKINGAKAIIKCLEAEGVEVVFGFPGAAICPVYDELLESKIKHVLVRQEQGAVHAASGYARASGKTGVCMATSGPGATNLITGIATAFLDSIPIVAITGQVSTELIGRDVFQEVDITGATAPFCKHNYLVKNTHDLPRIIKEAFHIASTGRPGPVLIDIPIDVQEKEISFSYPQHVDITGYKPTVKGHVMQIKRAAELINKSVNPLICAGGGVISANASPQVLELAELVNIPAVNTLMGKGSFPASHPLYLGMIGSHGVKLANCAIRNTDLLIIIGARAGDRALNTNFAFDEGTKVIHIDIDPAEIGKNIDVAVPIVGDVRVVLDELLEIVKTKKHDTWLEKINEWKKEFNKDKIENIGDYINPKYVLQRLSELAKTDTIITTDVGQHQLWTANAYKTSLPRTFISSGGLGTMGYGLPAAIGAKLSKPKATVVSITGDGSFQMNMQELGTMRQSNIGVKVILFNNGRLGMVRELQKMKYSSRYSAIDLSGSPDFIKLVSAYGIDALRVTKKEEIEPALKKMLKDDKPFFLEFMVNPEESTL